MRSLVTGANGFLGRHLVRELLARGHAVRALVRPGGDASTVDPGAEVARGDVTDPEALRRAVEGCAVVYHLAGIRRATRREDFLGVNAGSTRLALDACVATGARPRFVLAGSLAASGPSRAPLAEGDPLRPVEWYGESKAEAERIALSYADRLPVTVGRPPRIMGAGDRENLFFFRIVARGLVLRLLGPERPLSWVDVADCARGFALLGEEPGAIGEAFFIASPERTSLTGLQREAARALGVRARGVPLPPRLLSALAWVADLASTATGRRLPLNRKLARQVLAPGWTCSTEKAQARLGFSATTPLAESVASAARWYRDQGWL
jgi:nucleoside-diphosphate-sugar epimerase